MRNTKIRTLCECAIMVALAFVLSCIKLFQMPLGGSVTLASMLPIMLISIKHGSKIGVGTGFVYALAQLAQALAEGDVFVYCEGAGAVLVCLFFDYLIPFTCLGLAGIFKDLKIPTNTEISCYMGMATAIALRFICHFITGVVIWGQWAEGMSAALYSFIYNGSYLGADLALCLAVAFLLLRHKALRGLVGVK